VKNLAQQAGTTVLQPLNLHQATLAPFDLDVLIVAAYGLILPAHTLATPRYGCINVHASLLPRWRGAAPVERAIMAGDPVTGVSIMQMDAGLDTGPVYHQDSIDINPAWTGRELEDRLAVLGAQALRHCLCQLPALQPTPQVGTSSYAHKLTRQDCPIDWSQPASRVHNQVRALSGRMSASTSAQGVNVRILSSQVVEAAAPATPGTILPSDRHQIIVACTEAALSINQLQLDRGKGRPLTAAAARNGFAELFSPGKSLF
jgi:methionyl-tRNA formyltransferase